MRRLSLRARVVLIAMALLVVGMVASDAVVLAALRGPLTTTVDTQVRIAGRLLAGVPEELARALTQARAPVPLPDDELYLAYVSASGEVELEWRGASAPSLPTVDSAAVAARGGEPFEVPGWRVVTLPRQDGGSVVVAGSLRQVSETMDRVRLVCLLVGAGLLVLLAGIGWFWVRAGLRPLRRIEETAAAIAGGDLSRRVPASAPGTEIGRLTSSLNGMLVRIEEAVAARARSEERLRRFVADASHELRTPLAGISGFAQLYRLGGAEIDATMDRIERESVRLAELVDDLLLLAQLDERGLVLQQAPMDLRTLAVDAMHDLRALDPTRSVRLTGPGGGEAGAAPVLGDEAKLRQVVSNIVGNAVAHTPAGSAVRIGVGGDAAESVLEISDTGPGLPPDQAALVFERFYRADPARARDGGAGLGLAIVWSLVTAHGGTVEMDTAPGKGATVRIRLPSAG